MSTSDQPTSRPFYDEYAWAFDLVISQPVAEQCDFIAETFARRGATAGAKVLDAGCGTGRYAFELARRGFCVTGLDASPQLVAEARRRAGDLKLAGDAALPVSFIVGDILAPVQSDTFDAVLCRGVLNDLTDDESRGEIFHVLARTLRDAGALVFDVREWEASARRKSVEPVFEKTVETARGVLTFRSAARLDAEAHLLLVSERHALCGADGTQSVSEYEFAMRCWTRAEIEQGLAAAGFARVEYFGAYDRRTRAGATDRLVCAASLGGD